MNSDVRGYILLHLESVIQCYYVLVLLELFEQFPQKNSLVLPLPHLKIKKKKKNYIVDLELIMEGDSFLTLSLSLSLSLSLIPQYSASRLSI